MTHNISTQFAIYKVNLDTYNNILKRSINLAKTKLLFNYIH